MDYQFRVKSFLLIILALFGIIFIFGSAFSYWYLYTPAIPFCLLIVDYLRDSLPTSHKWPGKKLPRWLQYLLPVVVLSAFLFLAYGDVVHYFFTGTDTFSIIAPINSLETTRPWGIFAQKFQGNIFPLGNLYRPISTLSLILDYFLWKLKPFGYHVTDLGLHLLVSMIVYALARHFVHLNQGYATLSAALFILLPVHVNTVPVIARRQDILMATFFSLSLILLIQAEYNTQLNGKHVLYLLLSALLSFMALGTKETAIITPVVLAIYLFLFSKSSYIQSVLKLIPYLGLTILYLLIRYKVLGGIGTYSQPSLTFERAIIISSSYVRAFFYPLGTHFSGVLSTGLIVSGALLVFTVGFVPNLETRYFWLQTVRASLLIAGFSTLLITSPLIQRDSAWNEASNLQRRLLDGISQIILDRPPSTQDIFLLNFPLLIDQQKLIDGEALIMSDWGYNGYLRLVLPERQERLLSVNYIALNPETDVSTTELFAGISIKSSIDTGGYFLLPIGYATRQSLSTAAGKQFTTELSQSKFSKVTNVKFVEDLPTSPVLVYKGDRLELRNTRGKLLQSISLLP